MKQKERQERSRQQILQAALAEFGIHNYEDVTMEKICAAHGISKGMMYHYYANKDELFLLCVQNIFDKLRIHLETQAAVLASQDPLERIQNYFLIRECYFRQHPMEKKIFENALFRTPQHLKDEIAALRRPLRDMNLHFLQQIIHELALRPCIDYAEAIHYLEAVEDIFWGLLAQYSPPGEAIGLHRQTAAARRLVELLLFGVLRQAL